MLSSPAFYGLPAHFEKWRKFQPEAVQRTLDSNKRFVVLNAPTGFGKTLYYMAVSRISKKRTAILTSTKGLQDQLLRDYKECGLSERGGDMIEFFKSAKFKGVVATILFLILVPLYSNFVSDTVVTRITDAQMTMVDGKFMIATEYKPLVNSDANYRFKFDSGNIQNEAIRLKGKQVKIWKYGWRIPIFSMYENVVKIEEVK